jgi:Animal haem peroxidase
VSLLPSTLSQEDKFQIARRVVIAEQQYITYNEWLPAMGVALPKYTGYKPNVNATISNEFATVGYRVHSQIHGEFEFETNASRYSTADLDFFRAQGMEVDVTAGVATIALPLGVAFFNPDAFQRLQIGPLLSSFNESQYKNDEQIDNQLRSVLFQVPVSGNPDCLDGPTLPTCFNGVVDLGAIDIQRGRDHGTGTYNQMRNAYGLASKTSFTAITGESTENFPVDPLLTPGNEINDPNCLDIIALFDINGNPTTVANDNATRVVKRCTLAARLKAIYGSVSNLDAFVGMLAEKHLTGSELGELQTATWKDQFGAARDGDRFFYLNDPLQPFIRNNFGIDYRRTLAQVIASNTDIPLANLPANVFKVPAAGLAAQSMSSLAITADPVPSNDTRHKGRGAAGVAGDLATVPNRGPRTLHPRRRRRSESRDERLREEPEI